MCHRGLERVDEPLVGGGIITVDAGKLGVEGGVRRRRKGKGIRVGGGEAAVEADLIGGERVEGVTTEEVLALSGVPTTNLVGGLEVALLQDVGRLLEQPT